MKESDCKAALCKVLRGQLPPADSRVYRLEDAWTGGIPDIAISFAGRTLWVEVKLDRPGRRGKVTELQRASLKALCGFLLTFEDETSSLAARIETADGTALIRFRSSVKADVYRQVATFLLGRIR
jgi:hypothetical protein